MKEHVIQCVVVSIVHLMFPSHSFQESSEGHLLPDGKMLSAAYKNFTEGQLLFHQKVRI